MQVHQSTILANDYENKQEQQQELDGLKGKFL
jgi:hypothetical protein